MAVFVLLFSRVISQEQALKQIEGNALLVIGAGFCITEAIGQTNASEVMEGMVHNIDGIKSSDYLYNFTAYLILFMMTSLLANLIHPISAVSLMFPIGTSFIDKSDEIWSIRLVMMVAGSSGFLSPYSNHCNVIIGEVCNYDKKEFIKLGLPILIVSLTLTCSTAKMVGSWLPHCLEAD